MKRYIVHYTPTILISQMNLGKSWVTIAKIAVQSCESPRMAVGLEQETRPKSLMVIQPD